jgi:hypothetical protein
MFEHVYRSLVEGRRNQLNRAVSWFAVYTCAAARLGGALKIKRIIDWTGGQGIGSLVLHASDEGCALYERLGFIATTEMRFRG